MEICEEFKAAQHLKQMNKEKHGADYFKTENEM